MFALGHQKPKIPSTLLSVEKLRSTVSGVSGEANQFQISDQHDYKFNAYHSTTVLDTKGT